MRIMSFRLEDVRLAHGLCGVLVIFSLAVLGGYWANRQAAAAAIEEATLHELEHRAVALASAVSEQTRGAIYNLDLALLHLAHLYTVMGRLTASDVEEVKHATPPGLVRRVTLIDRNGVAAVSYPAGASGLLLQDRAHFQAHATGGQIGLFVGRPIESRMEQDWVIPLSRRLVDRNGKFAGVIAVMVSPKYFSDIYGRLTEGREDVVALVHQDGAFVSRNLGLNEHMGKSVRADRPFVGAQAPESGFFRSISTHEPIDRVFAFRRLNEWPLVTVIGLGVNESMMPVRAGRMRDNRSALAVSALVVVLVAGICIVVMRLERSLVRTRESDERRAMAFAGADELAWDWNVPGRQLRFFGKCRSFFGNSGDERLMSLGEWRHRVHPDERVALVRQSTDFLRNRRRGMEIRFRLKFADGVFRWVLVRGQAVAFDSDGKVMRALGIVMEVDAERRAQIEAAQTREAYRRLIESTGEGIFVVDENGVIQLFNPAAELLLGWRADEVAGQGAHTLFHPAAQDSPFAGDHQCPVSQTLGDGQSRRGIRLTYRHKSGRSVPVEVSVAPLVINGEVGGAVTVVTDVSQRLAYEAELERLARTDGLTGLWNRRYFVELFGRELNRAEREAAPLSLLMIDIDHFKDVNDRYGHAAGDIVLGTLAGFFRDQLRMIDLIGRLGGEEFGVGLPGIGIDEAQGVSERIRSGLEALQIDAGAQVIRCTVSIGIAQWTDQESFDALLARADRALYVAKRSGRNQVVVDQPRATSAAG